MITVIYQTQIHCNANRPTEYLHSYKHYALCPSYQSPKQNSLFCLLVFLFGWITTTGRLLRLQDGKSLSVFPKEKKRTITSGALSQSRFANFRCRHEIL